jgi:hypothetical protein
MLNQPEFQFFRKREFFINEIYQDVPDTLFDGQVFM